MHENPVASLHALVHTAPTMNPTVGSLLKAWRTEQGMTQQKAADALRVTQGQWSKWERDLEKPGLASLRALADRSDGGLSFEALVGAATPDSIRVAS